MSSLNVFILGITGYIGGAVGVALKRDYPYHEYVAFVRSSSSAPAIEKLGIKPLIGTGNAQQDLKLMSEASANADVVINMADADNLPMTEAILDGLKRTVKKQLPILLHTSGTGLLADTPSGAFQDPKIWDDAKPEDIRGIRKDAPHRNVDLAIFEAGQKKYFIGYFIAPSTIYGTGFANPGHKLSQQIPTLIRMAIEKRQTGYGGPGTNVWNNVHLQDCVDLYKILFDKSISERSAGLSSSDDPYTRFYWASAREHVWGDVSRAVAPILFKRGVVDNPHAISVPANEFHRALTTNSRSVSNRGFAVGWKPERPTLEATLEEGVDSLLKEDGLY